MRLNCWLLAALLIGSLSGCATTFQKNGMTGGFAEKQLEGDIWRISFNGNGYANYETVQTYWLYRCAELAVEKGFDGFEILSDIRLTIDTSPERLLAPEGRMEPAQMIFIPMDVGPMPSISADIKFLPAPVKDAPPRVFNAAALKADLDVHVNGKKCEMGNVCPHPHKYIYGEGSTISS